MAVSPDPFAQLRPATESDCDAIFSLLTEAFRDRLLQYTIFQSPSSIHYLRALVLAQNAKSARVFVMENEGRIEAFYDAVVRESDFFLNYIGVSSTARESGLGSLTLRHFESEAQRRNCRSVSLDVFESNDKACRWYANRKYSEVSRQILTSVRLDKCTRIAATTLTLVPGELERANLQLIEQGFTKVEATCSTGRLSIGLIASDCCKLLDFNGLTVEQAVASIATHFGNVRSRLLVTTNEPLGADIAFDAVENVRRLTKPL